MPNDYFKFKQFTIRQSACSMKVGTDGVLLGAWVAVEAAARRILDVGTGTGLIALMLAQRSPLAQVDAVEVDAAAASQARENAKSSPWAARLNIMHQDFNHFAGRATSRYDLLVSNPPYFSRSLTSPDSRRTAARHTGLLLHEDLIGGSLQLLSERGKLAVVMPCAEGNIFVAQAEKAGLHCNRKLHVAAKKGRPAMRLLMELSRSSAALDEQHLCIEDSALHSFTPEYQALTKEFYLKF